ncbi:MAG: hypothetical protein C4K48_06000 [Candidatus Thorarchaeota archaeon]|nr:MAG: hypothetical protein C4K48_06000 [Candidatus Thorarchaeota archaeon]
MKSYETGLSSKVLASVLVAVIITTGVFIIAVNLPGNGGNNTTTTPTNPVAGLGSKAALYLNSMRDNVVFYWMCNSTLVNMNLSDYYDAVHPGAFVDAVYMTDNETGGEITVLFSPFFDNIVGRGVLTETEWNALSGTIIDDGIGQMEQATSFPTGYYPHTWPIDFYMTAYFNDDTCFTVGFTRSDGFVYIVNGTWSGDFEDRIVPPVLSWGTGYWLDDNGHFAVPLQNLYTAITTTVPYPGA